MYQGRPQCGLHTCGSCKIKYAYSLDARKDGSEWHYKTFSQGKNLIIIPITYWMNRNKKPSNKEKMFYFINAQLVPKLPPGV